MFLDEMRHFLACLAGDAQPVCGFEDGVAALRIALAARLAASDWTVARRGPRPDPRSAGSWPSFPPAAARIDPPEEPSAPRRPSPLAWSIAAARDATRVDPVLVSTDDEEIRSAATEYGAEAPFLRPAALAQDDTPDLPVFEHALRWLEDERGRRPESWSSSAPPRPSGPRARRRGHQPASPAARDADSLRSVTHPTENPYKMWTLAERYLRPVLGRFTEEPWNRPRQQLPLVFWQTGHLDVVRRSTILNQPSMTGRRILPFAVDPGYAVDIDTLEQRAYAQWLIATADLDLVRPIPVEESA